MKKISKVLTAFLVYSFTLGISFVAAKAMLVNGVDSISFGIRTETPVKDPGYYLIWNEGNEIKLGSKVDTELKTTVTVATTGEQSFKVVDEDGTIVNETEGTITLDMSGTYTFCYRNGEKYSHGPTDYSYVYYSTYLTDNFGWGQSNIKCYLYNGSVNNTWPGNEDYTVAWEKKDQYGKEVYKISINANLYASENSFIIFNNGNGQQTYDIDLCSEVAETGKTAFYTNDSNNFTASIDVANISWWKDSGHHPVAYYFGGDSGDKYEEMSFVTGTTNKYVAQTPIDRTKYPKIIFVSTTTTGSGTGWPGGEVWKQTVDITIPLCEKSEYTLSTVEKDNKQTGSWGANIHGYGTYMFE